MFKELPYARKQCNYCGQQFSNWAYDPQGIGWYEPDGEIINSNCRCVIENPVRPKQRHPM